MQVEAAGGEGGISAGGKDSGHFTFILSKNCPFFSRERRKMKVEIGAGTYLSQLLHEVGVSSRLGVLKG